MPSHDLDALKGNLRDYVNSVTPKSKGRFWCCPLCGSGTRTNQTGAFALKDETHWHCYRCGRHGDIYDLCAAVEGLTQSDATKRIIELYGSPATEIKRARNDKPLDWDDVIWDDGDDDAPDTPSTVQPTAATPTPAQVQAEAAACKHSEEVARYAAALEGSPGQKYLQERGFTLETCRRFQFGYDADSDAITIPYNKQGTYYARRRLHPAGKGDRHVFLKGEAIPLFNGGALYQSEICFITESPLCAASIAQAGGAACSISGTSGTNRLINQLKKQPTQAVLVLCLDNDDAGRAAQAELEEKLEALPVKVQYANGVPLIMGAEQDANSLDYRKDVNEVLVHDGTEALHEYVNDTIEAVQQLRHAEALEAAQERAQRTGASMVDSFLTAIQTDKYRPLPTGISAIDKALYGGFTRQQVVTLGAAPGAGKTALAQWIFEGMAQRGTPVVYINLEMSQEQLLARSISRIAAQHGHGISTLRVMQGYRWTEEEREAILDAAEEYKQRIAPRFIMNPEGITPDLDTILGYMEAEAQRAEGIGAPVPVAVIDYLQLISGQPKEDAVAIIKRAVAGFKTWAVKHNSLCFIIIAHNRKSNSSGEVSMEAARDCSAIEYSSDIQLALTFTACISRNGLKAKTADKLEGDELNNVTLRIVKGRFGGRGTDVDLYFDGAKMQYTQIPAGKVEPEAEPEPQPIRFKF